MGKFVLFYKMINHRLVFPKMKLYAERFSTVKSEDFSQMRSVLHREGIEEPEASKICSLMPMSVEEAVSLIPQIEDKYSRENIWNVIQMLHELKNGGK